MGGSKSPGAVHVITAVIWCFSYSHCLPSLHIECLPSTCQCKQASHPYFQHIVINTSSGLNRVELCSKVAVSYCRSVGSFWAIDVCACRTNINGPLLDTDTVTELFWVWDISPLPLPVFLFPPFHFIYSFLKPLLDVLAWSAKMSCCMPCILAESATFHFCRTLCMKPLLFSIEGASATRFTLVSIQRESYEQICQALLHTRARSIIKYSCFCLNIIIAIGTLVGKPASFPLPFVYSLQGFQVGWGNPY